MACRNSCKLISKLDQSRIHNTASARLTSKDNPLLHMHWMKLLRFSTSPQHKKKKKKKVAHAQSQRNTKPMKNRPT